MESSSLNVVECDSTQLNHHICVISPLLSIDTYILHWLKHTLSLQLCTGMSSILLHCRQTSFGLNNLCLSEGNVGYLVSLCAGS